MPDVDTDFSDEVVDPFEPRTGRLGLSCSQLLDATAEHELANHTCRRRAIRELLDDPGHHGGENVRHVREQRDAR